MIELTRQRILGFIGAGGVSAFLLSIPRLSVAPQNQQPLINLGEFLTQLAVGLTLLGFGIVYWGFKPDVERGIARIQEQRSKQDEHEFEGKIKHTDDLKRVYDRLVSVMKKENDERVLVLQVPPPRMSLVGKDPSLEETRKEILENASAPWTEIQYVPNLYYAIEHLKSDKEYKNIYKYWEKSNQLLESYNEVKNESTRKELNQSLLYFRQNLLQLTDRMDNNHIVKGKCDICP